MAATVAVTVVVTAEAFSFHGDEVTGPECRLCATDGRKKRARPLRLVLHGRTGRWNVRPEGGKVKSASRCVIPAVGGHAGHYPRKSVPPGLVENHAKQSLAL